VQEVLSNHKTKAPNSICETMSLKDLPRDYFYMRLEDIKQTLAAFPHTQLIDAALQQKFDLAQLAILVKFECKLDPFEEMTMKDRVKGVVAFWNEILDAKADGSDNVDAKRIARAVNEILLAQIRYPSYDKPGTDPLTAEHLGFGCSAIKSICNLETKWIDFYQRELHSNLCRGNEEQNEGNQST
jgi:hypothetical protein